MLLDDPQCSPELGDEGLGVLHCLGARGEALQEELVGLLQPDVHRPHGAVGEGAYDQLLLHTVVHLQHPHLLPPGEGPRHPQVHVRALLPEDRGEDLAGLDVDPDPREKGQGHALPDHGDGLAHTELGQLEVVRAALESSCNTNRSTLSLFPLSSTHLVSA